MPDVQVSHGPPAHRVDPPPAASPVRRREERSRSRERAARLTGEYGSPARGTRVARVRDRSPGADARAKSVTEVAGAGVEHRDARRRSASSVVSWSRSEPPGWTIAVTPASISTCGPSANGKNASRRRDRAAQRLRSPWKRRAFATACRAGIDAADLARAEPDQPAVAHEDDRVRDDAADEAPREVEVRALAIVGWRARHDLPTRPGRRASVSGAVTRTAPPAVTDRAERIEASGGGRPRVVQASGRRRGGGSASSARISRASGSNAGATTTSRKIDVRAVGDVARRPAASARRRRRTPRPDRRRARRATPRGASARSAAPHGFVCLTMTHGRPAQQPRRAPPAAEASSTLLYESALPWSGG